MKEEYCVKECMEKWDNSHLTWGEKWNTIEDPTFEIFLNGTLEEKVRTLKQIKNNEKKRMR